jgi:hypothetical protein
MAREMGRQSGLNELQNLWQIIYSENLEELIIMVGNFGFCSIFQVCSWHAMTVGFGTL